MAQVPNEGIECRPPLRDSVRRCGAACRELFEETGERDNRLRRRRLLGAGLRSWQGRHDRVGAEVPRHAPLHQPQKRKVEIQHFLQQAVGALLVQSQPARIQKRIALFDDHPDRPKAGQPRLVFLVIWENGLDIRVPVPDRAGVRKPRLLLHSPLLIPLPGQGAALPPRQGQRG